MSQGYLPAPEHELLRRVDGLKGVMLTHFRLSGMASEDRKLVCRAIAHAVYTRRAKSEALPHNIEIHEGNVWWAAKEKVFASRQYPVGDELEKAADAYVEEARTEIAERKRNNDWQTGVNVLKNVELFGEWPFYVPADWKLPEIPEFQRAPVIEGVNVQIISEARSSQPPIQRHKHKFATATAA